LKEIIVTRSIPPEQSSRQFLRLVKRRGSTRMAHSNNGMQRISKSLRALLTADAERYAAFKGRL
jgi:hypothetical protein